MTGALSKRGTRNGCARSGESGNGGRNVAGAVAARFAVSAGGGAMLPAGCRLPFASDVPACASAAAGVGASVGATVGVGAGVLLPCCAAAARDRASASRQKSAAQYRARKRGVFELIINDYSPVTKLW